MRSLTLSLCIFTIIFSCGKNNSSSQINVTNGVEANASDYPYAIRLDSGCSGSFIGPRTVLTAAHCVLEVDLRYLSVTLNGRTIWPSKTISHAGYLAHRGNMSVQDLALLYFEEDIAPASIGISARKAQRLDAVRLVSFGMFYDHNGEAVFPNRLRTGTNIIAKIDHYIFIDGIRNAEAPSTGRDVAAAGGDSGGALVSIAENKLVGTTSGGNEYWDETKKQQRSLSQYTQLLQKDNLEFFRCALNLGVTLTAESTDFVRHVQNIPLKRETCLLKERTVN